jgi:hypothetical protein
VKRKPKPFAQLNLEIAGLGIILYSPFAVAHIANGEDYLQGHFWEAETVAKHVNACTLTCFGTGSSGRYRLLFVNGEAPAEEEARATMKLRLGIEIRDGVMCVRDLYDLMDWSAACPAGQLVRLRDGFYRLTVLSDPPRSGIIGDNQRITIYFEPTPKKPPIRHRGVPDLTPDDDES